MPALNLFPARVPIGKAQARDGSTMDVLMTVEFSRALAGVLERVGGTDGVSNTELSKLIKALSLQAVQLADQIRTLVELSDVLKAAIADQSILQAFDPEREEATDQAQEVEISNSSARIAELARRADDTSILLALQPERPALQKNTVTGAKGGNAALTSLLAALAKSGLITDSTT